MVKLNAPQRTFTIAQDKPSPGGDANGLWNGCPIIPLTKCGMALAKNAPPKKYER